MVQPPAQQGGQFPGAGKGEEPDSPCNAPEKQFCWHPDFSAMRSTVDSDHHSCAIINLCYVSCWVGGNLWEQLLPEQTTPFYFLTRTSAIRRARGRRSKGGKERFLPPVGSAKERGAQVNHSVIPVMGGLVCGRSDWDRPENSHQPLLHLTPTSLSVPQPPPSPKSITFNKEVFFSISQSETLINIKLRINEYNFS